MRQAKSEERGDGQKEERYGGQNRKTRPWQNDVWFFSLMPLFVLPIVCLSLLSPSFLLLCLLSFSCRSIVSVSHFSHGSGRVDWTAQCRYSVDSVRAPFSYYLHMETAACHLRRPSTTAINNRRTASGMHSRKERVKPVP